MAVAEDEAVYLIKLLPEFLGQAVRRAPAVYEPDFKLSGLNDAFAWKSLCCIIKIHIAADCDDTGSVEIIQHRR